MINLDAVSTETFQILRSFDLTVVMYDDDGNAVSEPEEARRFFASPRNLLVSIIDENDNSTLRLYLGQSSSLKEDKQLRRLVQTLRKCASKYNLMFQPRKQSKELTPKDFATRASVTEGENKMIDLTEGLYGTSRSSYLALENARMIIRHKKKIDETRLGARSRMIESILIENAAGERFLMPTQQLAPARAMTQHVNHGGTFADELGTHILRMGQAYSDLGQCSQFIQYNTAVLPESAVPIREQCKGSRKNLRKSFARLAKESTYASECNVITEKFSQEPLIEAATLENLRETLKVEGKELDESVLNTVAAYIGESNNMIDESEDLGPPAKDNSHETGVRPREEGTTRVLGHNIPTDIWEAFIRNDNRTIPLRHPPHFEHTPDFKTVTSEIFFKVSHIAPLVKDDAFSNLLADICEKYERTQNPSERKKYLTLAITALQAAKVPIGDKAGLGSRGVDAVREHEEWFAKFDPMVVLAEKEEECDECDEVIEEDADSKESHEDEFTKGLKEEDDLEDDVLEEEFEDDESDPIDSNIGNVDGEDDDDVMESEELTIEDVIIPKNPGLDLAREVSAKPKGEEDELEEGIVGTVSNAAKVAASIKDGIEVAKNAYQAFKDIHDTWQQEHGQMSEDVSESFDVEISRIMKLSGK